MVGGLGGRRDLPLRPDQHPRARSTRSTRRRRRSAGSLHVGHVFSYTHTDTVARYRGCAARRSSTRWAGTTTACRPSAGSRTTTASGATRRCRTTRRSCRPPSRRSDPIADLAAATSSSCATAWSIEDEQKFEELWRHLGLSVDWAHDLHDDRRRESQRMSQRGFLRMLARGEAYQAEAPTLWDVDFRTAVAQAELEDREMAGRVPQIRFATFGRSRRRRRRPYVVIETTRPELHPRVRRARRPSRRRALPAAVRTRRCVTPLFGVAVPVARAPPRRSREGLGHRDDLHVRRPHRRHVVARAAACRRVAIVGWDGRLRADPPVVALDARRDRGLRRARRARRSSRRGTHRRAAARVGRPRSATRSRSRTR